MPEYLIRRLSPSDLRPIFDCNDDDLNEFFAVDWIAACQELLSVTYVVEIDNELAAFFSLSNDAIKKVTLEKRIFKRIASPIPRLKRYSTLPVLNIQNPARKARTFAFDNGWRDIARTEPW